MPINDTCEGTVIKAVETDNDTQEFGKCSMKETVHPEIKKCLFSKILLTCSATYPSR